jgi:hypothetical protein
MPEVAWPETGFVHAYPGTTTPSPVSTSSDILFDTSLVVHFRSSLCHLFDPILCRTFSFCAHDRGSCPPPPKAIWDPLLSAGPEGPLPVAALITGGRGYHSVASAECKAYFVMNYTVALRDPENLILSLFAVLCG